MFYIPNTFFGYTNLEIIETTSNDLTYLHKLTSQGWKSSPTQKQVWHKAVIFDTLAEAKLVLYDNFKGQLKFAANQLAVLQEQLSEQQQELDMLTTDLQLNHPEVLI